MSEFVGLRSKMYSVRAAVTPLLKRLDTNATAAAAAAAINIIRTADAMKKAKGVKRYVLQKELTFDDYLKCVMDGCIVAKHQNSIRSKLHKVFTIREKKVALSPFDNKRIILDDNINTLPWAHYRTTVETR